METASALEKLFPKQCQVLGIVTPGIVGERHVDPMTPSCALSTVNYLWPKAYLYFFSIRSTVKSVVLTTVSNWLVPVFFRLPRLTMASQGCPYRPVCCTHVLEPFVIGNGGPASPSRLPPCGLGTSNAQVGSSCATCALEAHL